MEWYGVRETMELYVVTRPGYPLLVCLRFSLHHSLSGEFDSSILQTSVSTATVNWLSFHVYSIWTTSSLLFLIWNEQITTNCVNLTAQPRKRYHSWELCGGQEFLPPVPHMYHQYMYLTLNSLVQVRSATHQTGTICSAFWNFESLLVKKNSATLAQSCPTQCVTCFLTDWVICSSGATVLSAAFMIFHIPE